MTTYEKWQIVVTILGILFSVFAYKYVTGDIKKTLTKDHYND